MRITPTTTITPTFESFLDIIFTNKPAMFKRCGTFNPQISDHNLVCGILSESVNRYKPKTIVFRSTKNLEVKKFNEAPWIVGESLNTSR